jgi:enediyne biosynthesis protein E4
MRLLVGSCLVAVALTAGSRGDEPSNRPAFLFRDVAASAGLFPAVEAIRGHGAGWGDVDGDGWPDLHVTTFGAGDDRNNMLLRNLEGKFELVEQPALQVAARGTGTIFADFDNDGHLDLYVASMPQPKNEVVGCRLYRNDGKGTFVDVSEQSGACPPDFGGRSVCVLDYDGDGRLDLLVGEDPLPGYNGSPTKSSRLFRNLGGFKFVDATEEAGIPSDIPGLGVAAADVNNDGWPDLFLASHSGGNRLLLNRRGKFEEVVAAREVFHWPQAGGDNMVCGVAFGDVNRDGLMDIVLGQHFKNPWQAPVASRLYLNRGVRNGTPVFEDVTEPSGLVPLAMKAPHVEFQDFDNDGWPDISTSLVMFAEGKPHPVIFKHLGVQDGLPRFRADALSVNDFPTAQDRATRRSGDLFDRLLQEKKVIYMAAGPTADFDRDGRLDMFLPSWWKEAGSLLLRNETPSGNWLQVEVRNVAGVNSMGIGARIHVYPAGKLGDASSLLGCREIAVGFGYGSGQEAIAHFGLGDEKSVDLEIILPHQAGRLERKSVAANQRISITK